MNGMLVILGQIAPDEGGLTVTGTIIMTASVLLVLGLMVFCMTRILRETRPEEHHHAPLDIDTHDLDP